MGHREDLLAGAKKCLYEKGYARTTARDIVAASNTNLASIGYHFGSKEALLNAALIEASDEMAEEFIQLTGREMTSGRPGSTAEAWDRAMKEFARYRQLLIAQVEAWAQVERSPELRSELARHYEDGRVRGTAASKDMIPAADDRTGRAIAAVTMALADGLIIQWLLDPDQAPTGEDIALGIRALAGVASVTDPDIESGGESGNAHDDESGAEPIGQQRQATGEIRA
ncbi:TetR/AcrR family transcriptional regulator [Phytoactinopolyspora alkaliphila]|uniref:TetR/AcrR family transcriptional regulator n=1 Tax=Phytoactinopolyspora alkaliphila TaxID=1783498 RepID=A0A6N9YQL4_9ACTN|nr:TetR/AcrR family transcriptional regulator [Phytoactinopolyspora alkaliphila]NED97220.1 TetR/AcrR family transcriptional regulator [Phytoactinopolyspora alkaliphila]